MTMRIGTGYDVHKLVYGRKLVLGGVIIPFEKGLHGHSDADVLVHSLCDALLGAACLGDIGQHFPDSDPRFKDISSLILLEKCLESVLHKGYCICNADCTVFAELPKLAPFKKDMENRMAQTLKIDSQCVNVKATTTEGLGFVGRGEGIAASSVVLIKPLGC